MMKAPIIPIQDCAAHRGERPSALAILTTLPTADMPPRRPMNSSATSTGRPIRATHTM